MFMRYNFVEVSTLRKHRNFLNLRYLYTYVSSSCINLKIQSKSCNIRIILACHKIPYSFGLATILRFPASDIYNYDSANFG